MAEPLRPASAKTYTRVNWIYIPTIASGTLAPTVAEATAASALDITNMAFAGGEPQPTQSTNLVEQTRRFGDAALYQFVGTTTYAGGEVRVQFNQQGAALADDVKAWEKFAAGSVTGFWGRRINVPKATAITAGQFIDIFPMETGPAMPILEGDGEAAEGGAMFSFAITSAPAFKVAILT